jgi:hypothetical protein
MQNEIITIASIATGLINLGVYLHQLGAEKKKEWQSIRDAVSKAFHATESYYRMLEAGHSRDTEKECRIAEKWENTSMLIEPFDADLSKRLGLKGNFWRSGAAWSKKEIHAAGIELERVRAEGMTLFNEGNK